MAAGIAGVGEPNVSRETRASMPRDKARMSAGEPRLVRLGAVVTEPRATGEERPAMVELTSVKQRRMTA